MNQKDIQEFLTLLDGGVDSREGRLEVTDAPRLRQKAHRLAEISVLERGKRQAMARFLTRQIAAIQGIYLASIHDLYVARGKGTVPNTFTVPAINLRALSFDAARSVFRAARSMDAGAFIFEIARSEMGYTDQRPAEYVTNVLAAALAEGYRGPVFVQGDHFQVSAKRYASSGETELQAVRDLTQEAISAGFFNIDIDTSTLVDLSRPNLDAQQELNTRLSAMFTQLVRKFQPEGITISVGGEIGEVGSQNSTVEELRAYMNGYNAELDRIAPGVQGLSKISVQTGTTHGGVVLPDGTIAQVAVDFDTLCNLSRVARQEYQMGGAVQHGASTLPESAFGKFVEAEAIEIHLATNFMNMFFDRLPGELRHEMYAYLDEHHASDRKPGMTDEQFYYKTRKNVVGLYKAQCWGLEQEKKAEIGEAWEQQFTKLFRLLGLEGTRPYVDQTIHPIPVEPDEKFYLGAVAVEEDVADLAD